VYGAFESTSFRSTDGGRHWTRLDLVGATTGVAFVGTTAYATAGGHGNACVGAVYRSADLGRTWRQLRTSCAPVGLFAVSFLDRRRGFAAGGTAAKFGGSQLLEQTVDGGETWHSVWRTEAPTAGPSNDQVVRMTISPSGVGWMLTGGCTMGADGPCGGRLMAGTNGGHRWSPTDRGGLAVASTQSGVTLLATDHDLARTVGSGTHWKVQTTPAMVTTTSFATGAGRLVWQDDVGTLESADGVRWAAAEPAVVTNPPGQASLFSKAVGPDGTAWALTGQDGECLDHVDIAAVQSRKPGWQPDSGSTSLQQSGDNGAHWTLAEASVPTVGYTPLAVSDALMAVVDQCGHLQVSQDRGRTWSGIDLGSLTCDVSAFARELWLTCDAVGALGGSFLLHSTDAGGTWTAHRYPAHTAFPINQLAAVGPGRAAFPDRGSIWLTTDGGSTWAQSWPSQP
jgi:hypothetical protein